MPPADERRDQHSAQTYREHGHLRCGWLRVGRRDRLQVCADNRRSASATVGMPARDKIRLVNQGLWTLTTIRASASANAIT
jgi:hypothetical protein